MARALNLESRRQRAVFLFLSGFTHPSTAFVKGEPTKKDKVARNIFGVSICMNVIGRILFGDYVASVSDSWGVCEHKVGLDFNTPQGLAKLRSFTSKLFLNNQHARIVSDDVQGWEYQDRPWMHQFWHSSYRRHAMQCNQRMNTHPELYAHAEMLYTSYMMAELYAPVMFSDGRLIIDPFYYCKSGRFLTHLQNSDSRAALGMALSRYWTPNTPHTVCMTNGDDYVGVEGDEDGYKLMGFVLTDRVEQKETRISFCSQIFIFPEVGPNLRYPDGLAKLFANAILSSTDDAFLSVVINAEQHPGYESFLSMCTYWRSVIRAKTCTLENEE